MYGIEGRWAGPVTPLDPTCGQATTGLMSVGGGKFGFDPFQSTTVIYGTVSNRKLQGGLARTGANKEALSINFEAKASKEPDGKAVVKGRLSSGRCQWDVALERG
ncbi:MAG: hypothetical protein JOY71_19580 [Acetobacteraceae bacterium]|nr:hypothetical protein [Acetobacteraceae bacterium]